VVTQDIERRVYEALSLAGLIKEAKQNAPVAGTDASSPVVTNLFQHPAAHPYVLDLALLQKYGPVWLEWERETLEHQIPNDFHTGGISDLNMSKLQAIKCLHLVDGFWQSWEVFLAVTMSLNSLFPDFEVMQVPTVAQCAVAIDTASRIRPGPKWSDEMLAYLEVVHKHDGIACAVGPLDFVEIDNEDYPVNCEEIQELWPLVRSTRQAPTGDTSTPEQLRRLLVIHKELTDSQQQLASQLRSFIHE